MATMRSKVQQVLRHAAETVRASKAVQVLMQDLNGEKVLAVAYFTLSWVSPRVLTVDSVQM